jgi:hypothetical protein
MGPEVTAGLILYSMDQARAVFALFRKVSEAASDDFTSQLVLRKAPPAPFLPPEVHRAPVVGNAVCHIGPPEVAHVTWARRVIAFEGCVGRRQDRAQTALHGDAIA